MRIKSAPAVGPAMALPKESLLVVAQGDNEGDNKHLVAIRQIEPSGDRWDGWDLGGSVGGEPAVGKNQDRRLEVFAPDTDGALWHIWQTAPDDHDSWYWLNRYDQWWSEWSPLGTRPEFAWFGGAPAVGRNADGRLEVFARSTDGSLWHIYQTAANNGWSDWYSLGGSIASDPVVHLNARGCLEVFAAGTDGALWHIWQQHLAPSSDAWEQWSPLGSISPYNRNWGVPAVGTDADGHFEVFAHNEFTPYTETIIGHIWERPEDDTWTDWVSQYIAITSDLAIALDAHNCLQFFYFEGGTLLNGRQTAANNRDSWGSWHEGTVPPDERVAPYPVGHAPTVGRDADGSLEVFVCSEWRNPSIPQQDNLWHLRQNGPCGPWSEWRLLPNVAHEQPV